MNRFERAVIEAARVFVRDPFRDAGPIAHSVASLEEHEKSQVAAGTTEIEWSLVCAGDEIRGRSGTFFPVIRVRAEVEDGRPTGRRVIQVGLPGGPRSIVRPNETEPFAVVRRGEDGRAVDEFEVIFSGEK